MKMVKAVLLLILPLFFSVPLPAYAGTPAAAAVVPESSYTWEDTGGPGNAGASSLLFIPERNELYQGTGYRGVWCYNPALGTWRDTGGGVQDSLVSSLAWDGGGLYAGTVHDGVWRYDPGTREWTDLGSGTAGFNVESLAWDGGGLYAGTFTHGVWRYDPGGGTWSDTGGGMSTCSIMSLAWDGSGLYAGTDVGVWRYDPGTGIWTDTGGGVSTYSIMSLAWDGSGLYAGTHGHGVWRFNPVLGAWTDGGGGLSGSSVYSLAWDGSGLYAGTAGGGVWRYDGSTWSDKGSAVSGGWYLSLAWDGNGLYAGATDGVWRFDPATGEWAATESRIGGDIVDSLAWDGSGLFASTEGGTVWRYEPATQAWTSTGDIPGTFYISALAWDGSGLYAGTDVGVWRYDPGTGLWTDTGGVVSTYSIMSLAWDGSGLYAGTHGHDVWRYDPGAGTWTSTSPGSTYNIRCLAWTGSGLYAGTDVDGVWYYNPSTTGWSNTGGAMQTYKVRSLAWAGDGLYAGTDSHDVWFYDPDAHAWYDTSGGGTSFTAALAWDGSGSLYASIQGGGVKRYDSHQGKWYPTGGRVSSISIYTLAWGGASLYAGSYQQSVWHYGPDTWYLAEGSTDGGMETYVLVQNPGEADTHVNIEFQTDSGEQAPADLQGVTIPASSRRTFKVNDYVTTYDVSTKVEALDGRVVCERAVYGDGRAWAHESIGTTDPARVWLLAEGCTDGGMETWVLVQNPGLYDVQADLTFQTESGERAPADLQGVTIPASSRRTFKVNDYVTSYNVSTKVSASGKVVCERAMYGNGRAWAHDSVGVSAPAPSWNLAEGCTDGGMETWVLVQNPNDIAVDMGLLFQTGSGLVTGPQESIPAGSRRSYRVNDFVTTYDVSTHVSAVGGFDIVCERAVYGDGGAWATDSIGATSTATVWNLAEGCTDGGMETWILVQNPNSIDVKVSFTLMTGDGAQQPAGLQNVAIPAGTRASFNLGSFVTTYDVSTRVEVVGGKAGVVCERAMYGNGRTWAHDSIGY